MPSTSILVLSANPLDTERLRFDAEAREIRESLLRAKKSDDFHIEISPAATPKDINRALQQHSPAIVHFSGHGKGEDGLVFDDGQGNSLPVKSEALAALFQLFAADVKCVLLNACYSEVQARSIARHIDYVIGMSREISDKAALVFAAAFYDALGAGRRIEFAYRSACVQLQLQNIPEHLAPVLIQRRHAAVSTASSQAHVDDITVFLAEVPDDLSALRRQVQTALEQINIRVLPEQLYSFPNAAGLQAQLNADLQQSRLFVQLLNTTNPQRPPGMNTPLVQAERARVLRVPALYWYDREFAAIKNRTQLFDMLKCLLPAQFEEILFAYKIPLEYLTADNQAQRAMEVIRYSEGRDELAQLQQAIESRTSQSSPPRFAEASGKNLGEGENDRRGAERLRELDANQADLALQELLEQAETGDLPTFLNNLLQHLQALQNRKPPEENAELQNRKPPKENADMLVFLNAAQEDTPLLQDLKPQLEAQKFSYDEPLQFLHLEANAEPDAIRTDLEGNLCDCQAVILLYCKASSVWLREQLRRCHSALRKRKEPLQVMMMCRCAKRPEHVDLDKKYPKLKLHIVDCQPPFSDSCLSHFLEALRYE
ncbi:MAG: CHAT domain-containing protein [Gammaproteobacteria bacterium]|nr:CHAT domain-containing protein [Gammaproteobacteria bacterium]